ncbi:MAG: SOS response-associated peptidase [Chitinophagales bacterium]|nr:SOS response-associated peptidase [Chitinophagales bacterium]
MCGRFSLTKTKKELEQRYKSSFCNTDLDQTLILPNFNVAPTHYFPICLNKDGFQLSFLRWGLIPSWSKDMRIGSKLINARAETLGEKPAFKHLLASHRCLIPMDGFYEWEKRGATKVPYRIMLKSLEIFSVAGIWDTWIDSDNNEPIDTFTIITVEANAFMSPLHHRMPAIVEPNHEFLWLDQTISESEALKLLVSYDSDAMESYRVSSDINSVYANDKDLILPIQDDDQKANEGQQLSLF